MAHVQAQLEVGAVDVADCAVHRAIKAAMDPDNILNRGKVGALGEL
jgi:FAD/FMN-containing dehydrogenase